MIDFKNGKHSFTIDGKDLAGDDVKFLREEFNEEDTKSNPAGFEELFLPKNAVAVGETWKLEIDDVAKPFAKAMEFDASKSTAGGKLIKAYKKDNKQFGIFETELHLAITKILSGPIPMQLSRGSVTKIIVQFDGCIDGSINTGTTKMSMEMQMAGTLKNPNGVEVKMQAKINSVSSRSTEDLSLSKPR